MSLFEEAEKTKNPFGSRNKADTTNQKVAYINQTSILLRIMNEVCSEQKVSSSKMKDYSSHRTRIGDCSWSLHNLQGNVTEPTWANVVNAALGGFLKTIKNSQPNGEWKLCDFETKIKTDEDNIEKLFFVAKFVDMENQSDLTYRNGMPVTTTVNVNASPVSAELIEALSAKKTDDSDLKNLIKQLAEVLTSQASQKVSQEVTVNPDDLEPASSEAAPVVFDD